MRADVEPCLLNMLRQPSRTLGAARSGLLLGGGQQCEGVLDALLEDRVGELSIGQGARELERPDQ